MALTLLTAGTASVPRCRACQLQLCKSRSERPHAALTERPWDDADGAPPPGSKSETAFTCSTCGALLVRSTDMTRPGWRHGR